MATVQGESDGGDSAVEATTAVTNRVAEGDLSGATDAFQRTHDAPVLAAGLLALVLPLLVLLGAWIVRQCRIWRARKRRWTKRALDPILFAFRRVRNACLLVSWCVGAPMLGAYTVTAATEVHIAWTLMLSFGIAGIVWVCAVVVWTNDKFVDVFASFNYLSCAGCVAVCLAVAGAVTIGIATTDEAPAVGDTVRVCSTEHGTCVEDDTLCACAGGYSGERCDRICPVGFSCVEGNHNDPTPCVHGPAACGPGSSNATCDPCPAGLYASTPCAYLTEASGGDVVVEVHDGSGVGDDGTSTGNGTMTAAYPHLEHPVCLSCHPACVTCVGATAAECAVQLQPPAPLTQPGNDTDAGDNATETNGGGTSAAPSVAVRDCAAGYFDDAGVCRECSTCDPADRVFVAAECTRATDTVCSACEPGCVECNTTAGVGCAALTFRATANGTEVGEPEPWPLPPEAPANATVYDCGSGFVSHWAKRDALSAAAAEADGEPAGAAANATASDGDADQGSAVVPSSPVPTCARCTPCPIRTYATTSCTAWHDFSCEPCDQSCAEACNGPTADNCTAADGSGLSCAANYTRASSGKCVPCREPCPPGEFELRPCTQDSARVCAPCRGSCDALEVQIAECSVGADLQCVSCPAGSGLVPSEGACFPCPLPSTCVGGGNCSTGADPDSLLCGSCLQGWYPILGDCAPCPSLTWAGILIGLGAILVVSFFTASGALNEQRVRQLRILAVHAQLINAYFTFELPWPEWCRAWARTLQAAMGDLALYSPQCALQGGGWYLKLGLSLSLAIVVLLILIAVTRTLAFKARRDMVLNARTRRSVDASKGGGDAGDSDALPTAATLAGPGATLEAAADAARDAAAGKRATDAYENLEKVSRVPALLLAIGYVPVLRVALEGMDCVDTPAGWVLQRDVNVDCTNAVHVTVAAGCAVVAVLVGIAFPIGYIWHMRGRASGSSEWPGPVPARAVATKTRVLAMVKEDPQRQDTGYAHEHDDNTWLARKIPSLSRAFHRLAEPYKQHLGWFEGVLLLHRSVVVWLEVNFAQGILQASIACAASFVVAVVIWLRRPWKRVPFTFFRYEMSDALNTMACVATMSGSISLLLGMMANVGRANELGIAASALSGGAATVLFVMLLWPRIRELRMSEKDKKKLAGAAVAMTASPMDVGLVSAAEAKGAGGSGATSTRMARRNSLVADTEAGAYSEWVQLATSSFLPSGIGLSPAVEQRLAALHDVNPRERMLKFTPELYTEAAYDSEVSRKERRRLLTSSRMKLLDLSRVDEPSGGCCAKLGVTVNFGDDSKGWGKKHAERFETAQVIGGYEAYLREPAVDALIERVDKDHSSAFVDAVTEAEGALRDLAIINRKRFLYYWTETTEAEDTGSDGKDKGKSKSDGTDKGGSAGAGAAAGAGESKAVGADSATPAPAPGRSRGGVFGAMAVLNRAVDVDSDDDSGYDTDASFVGGGGGGLPEAREWARDNTDFRVVERKMSAALSQIDRYQVAFVALHQHLTDLKPHADMPTESQENTKSWVSFFAKGYGAWFREGWAVRDCWQDLEAARQLMDPAFASPAAGGAVSASAAAAAVPRATRSSDTRTRAATSASVTVDDVIAVVAAIKRDAYGLSRASVESALATVPKHLPADAVAIAALYEEERALSAEGRFFEALGKLEAAVMIRERRQQQVAKQLDSLLPSGTRSTTLRGGKDIAAALLEKCNIRTSTERAAVRKALRENGVRLGEALRVCREWREWRDYDRSQPWGRVPISWHREAPLSRASKQLAHSVNFAINSARTILGKAHKADHSHKTLEKTAKAVAVKLYVKTVGSPADVVNGTTVMRTGLESVVTTGDAVAALLGGRRRLRDAVHAHAIARLAETLLEKFQPLG